MKNLIKFKGGGNKELVVFNIPDVFMDDGLQAWIDDDDLRERTNIPLDQHAFFYYYNQRIFDLEKIEHDESTISLLNNKGVHIYLFEPICSSLDPTFQYITYTDNFYSEFEHREDLTIYSPELESIKFYILKNNLTNVTVHTCDYNIEKHYTNYLEYMKFNCKDSFLETFGYAFNYENPPNLKFNRKFICTNWRYTKHRHIVSCYLANKSAHLSWFFRQSFESLERNIWFDLKQWELQQPHLYKTLKEGGNTLSEKAPYCLDTIVDIDETSDVYLQGNSFPKIKSKNNQTPMGIVNIHGNRLETFYNDSFCEIVTETRFAQPTANFSEKLLRPIQYKRPFILLAPPFTLEYLKNYGFETFNNFWDESYDTIQNHEKRLLKIFEILEEIDSYSLSELTDMYKQMNSIFIKNIEVSRKHNFLRKPPVKIINQ